MFFLKYLNVFCGFVYKYDDIYKTINSIYVLINSKQFLKSKVTDIDKEKKIKDFIKKELLYLGYNLLYLGTKYLIETIYVIYALGELCYDNLENEIYPIVANKYGKNVHNIKCNIRNATEMMYFENTDEKIMYNFKYSYPQKPKTKDVISIVLNNL